MRSLHLLRHFSSFASVRWRPRVNLPFKVKEIIEDPVVSEIDVETPSGLIVTSVITTRSVKALGLAVGRCAGVPWPVAV